MAPLYKHQDEASDSTFSAPMPPGPRRRERRQEKTDVPTPTQARNNEEESDIDTEDHVMALMSSVTKVLDSLVTFAVPNGNSRLMLRGIDGADVPITHTGYIPDVGSFVVCEEANSCLLSVRELIREGHHVSFTLTGAIIRGREGGSIIGYTRPNGLTYVLRADLQVLRSDNPTGATPPTPDNDHESYSAHTHTI
ncbi:hypothetical protein B484DRAFT_410653 [Ochromonadaceae sp. CCMP2298]|nr:hypothetical protein B484DRAFT_410653 [Ochromonadaceae sp. CCMP2298]